MSKQKLTKDFSGAVLKEIIKVIGKIIFAVFEKIIVKDL